jgi:hypothetical protein
MEHRWIEERGRGESGQRGDNEVKSLNTEHLSSVTLFFRAISYASRGWRSAWILIRLYLSLHPKWHSIPH